MSRVRRPSARMRRAGPLAIALALALGASACSSEPPPPTPSRVERAPVVVKVAASGALTSVDSQNLGFRAGDRIKAVNVKVGDTIRPGQVLAELDDLRPRNLRDSARGAVGAARANLQLVVDGVQVQNAVRLRDQAARSLERARASVGAQVAAARNNVRQAEIRFAFDLRDLRAKNIKARESGCDTSRSDESNFSDTSRDANPQASITGAPSAGGGTGGATTGGTGGGAAASAPAPSGAGALALGGLDPTAGMGDGSAMYPTSGDAATGTTTAAAADDASAPTCVVADRTAAATAFTAALTSRTALASARRALEVAERGGAVTVEAARTALITADTNLRTARVTRPNTIDQLRAALRSAESALSTAEGNLADTVLYAPVGGVVAAINGTVGEFAGTGSGTSAQAPGSEAPIPGVGAAASSDQAGSAASGISATRPGGAAFIQLNNVNAFQAVVPLEETDGTRVQPGQRVEVTFDSLPGFVGDGSVLTVAPNGVNISGVTNYYATIVMSNSDPRLRPGLTAQAGVLVEQLDGALTVPNSLVVRRDGRSFVLVPGPEGQAPTEREFQPGLVGDLRTEVLQGLEDGEPIVAPPVPEGATVPN